MSSHRLSVQPIKAVSELASLLELRSTSEGPPNAPLQVYERLWSAYPDGFIGAFMEGRLVAGAVFLPVNKEWVRAVSAGEASASLWTVPVPSSPYSGGTEWLVTGLAVQEELRGQGIAKKTLRDGLIHWTDRASFLYPSRFYTATASLGGKRLIERTGWALQNDGRTLVDECPFYRYEVRSSDHLWGALTHLADGYLNTGEAALCWRR